MGTPGRRRRKNQPYLMTLLAVPLIHLAHLHVSEVVSMAASLLFLGLYYYLVSGWPSTPALPFLPAWNRSHHPVSTPSHLLA